MKFAVMQPYLFPYLGYYQLVHSVDKFIFYDDVTFIKGGYINRNSIMVNGESKRFTVPVPGISSNKLINELYFDCNVKKILKTLEQSYSKAPYFRDVYPIIREILTKKERCVSTLCRVSVEEIFMYLNIKKELINSSDLVFNRNKNASEKLIEMSKVLACNEYVNAIGGSSMYDKKHFLNKEVELYFIKMKEIRYEQSNNKFVPNLSIIDVLMHNSKKDIILMLDEYELI